MVSQRSIAACAALTLLLASGASAQLVREDGWIASSLGFELGPILGTAARRPLYVDAQGRALVLVIHPNCTTGGRPFRAGLPGPHASSPANRQRG